MFVLTPGGLSFKLRNGFYGRFRKKRGAHSRIGMRPRIRQSQAVEIGKNVVINIRIWIDTNSNNGQISIADEVLGVSSFRALREVKMLIEACTGIYSHKRPHKAIKNKPPVNFLHNPYFSWKSLVLNVTN